MEQILWTSLSQEFRVKLKMAEEDVTGLLTKLQPWSFLDILRSPGSLENRSLEQLGLRPEEILDVQPDELLIPGTQRKPVKRGTAVSTTNMDRHGDYPSARSSAPVLTENQDFCIAGAHALWYTTTGHTSFEHTGTTLPAKAQFDTICDLQQEYHLREDERVQPDSDVLVHT